jgi:hypothetical protein
MLADPWQFSWALVALLASPALGRPGPPPHHELAATGAVGTKDGSGHASDGSRTPTSFALLLGGLVGALLLIGLAALPATAVPRFARRRVDRLDIVLAGALALLAVTIVYVAGVL